MFTKYTKPFFEAQADDNGQPTETGTEQQEQAKTFTQDEVNRVIADRLARERAKYGDYEDLKSKAAKLAELEKQQMTASEKLTAERDEALKKQSELTAKIAQMEANALKQKLCSEAGIPMAFASRLQGSTEEEIKADIEILKEALPKPRVGGSGTPNGSPASGGKEPPNTLEAAIAAALRKK